MDRPLVVFERRHRLLGDCVANALACAGIPTDRLEPPCDDVDMSTVRRHPLVVLDSAVLGDHHRSALADEMQDCDANVLVVTTSAVCCDGNDQVCAEVVNATDDLETLVAAVHRLAPAGEADLQRRHDEAIESDTARAALALLSPRERTVLDGMMCGLSAIEIADAHYVAVTTVRSQIRSILTKLNVRSQLAAVALAHEVGWRADGRRIHQI